MSMTVMETAKFIAKHRDELLDMTKNWEMWKELTAGGVPDEFILRHLKVTRKFYLCFVIDGVWTPYCILSDNTVKDILKDDRSFNSHLNEEVYKSFYTRCPGGKEGYSSFLPAGYEFEVLIPPEARLIYSYFPSYQNTRCK